jgi:Flp pilus assembly pilin Flp
MLSPKSNYPKRQTTGSYRGQALAEYALIAVLVVLAMVAILAVTDDAVGNVFSNTVYSLLEGTVEPRSTLAPEAYWSQMTAVASYTPDVLNRDVPASDTDVNTNVSWSPNTTSGISHHKMAPFTKIAVMSRLAEKPLLRLN